MALVPCLIISGGGDFRGLLPSCSPSQDSVGSFRLTNKPISGGKAVSLFLERDSEVSCVN